MRTKVFLFAIGLTVLGCKDPGAEVTAAKVEPVADTKTEPVTKTKPGTDASGALAIDPSNSKIEFVGAKVTASHPGGFTDFSGTLSLGDPLETSTIEVTIQTASIYTDKEKLTKHLKSPDFLDVEKIPTASFKSTQIMRQGDGYLVIGSLTLHGVTMRISFPATISVSESEVSASAEFSINRQAFAIKYRGMPDDLIRDLVVIKLSLKLPR